MIFKDRKEAGKELSKKLKSYKDKKNVVILGLPRGGVVNAFEIAKELNLPLDVLIVRKIGAPENPELAIGAMAEGGEIILNEDILSAYQTDSDYMEKMKREKTQEINERSKMFRKEGKAINLEGKTAIIVDDGVATGATVRVAIKAVKAKKAKQIILAVPVIAEDSLRVIEKEVDQVIYLEAPVFFGAVGNFYENFNQVEDEEVVKLLKEIK